MIWLSLGDVGILWDVHYRPGISPRKVTSSVCELEKLAVIHPQMVSVKSDPA